MPIFELRRLPRIQAIVKQAEVLGAKLLIGPSTLPEEMAVLLDPQQCPLASGTINANKTILDDSHSVFSLPESAAAECLEHKKMLTGRRSRRLSKVNALFGY